MPSILSQTGGLSGVPLGDMSSPSVNASKPRTFVPPTGANTGSPGRPRSIAGQGQGGAGAGAAGAGSVPAPPNVAALTNPQQLLQGLTLAGGGGSPGAPGAAGAPLILPPQPGQMHFDPFTGVWTMPDGRQVQSR